MIKRLCAFLLGLAAIAALAGPIVQTGPRIFVEPPPAQAVGSITFTGGSSTSSSPALQVSILNENAADVGDGELTIESFVRCDSEPGGNNDSTTPTEGANYTGTDGNILFDGDKTDYGRGYIVGLDGGVLYLSVINAGGSRTLIGTSDLRNDTWTHVAAQFNAANGLMEVLVGGSEEDTITGPTGTVALNQASVTTSTDGQLVAGKEKLNITFGADCDISEFRLSDVRRYTGTSYTPPSGPFTSDADTMLLYHFDEGSGTTAGDSSSNNLDATLIGSPTPAWSTEDPFGALGIPATFMAANDDTYRLAA